MSISCSLCVRRVIVEMKGYRWRTHTDGELYKQVQLHMFIHIYEQTTHTDVKAFKKNLFCTLPFCVCDGVCRLGGHRRLPEGSEGTVDGGGSF